MYFEYNCRKPPTPRRINRQIAGTVNAVDLTVMTIMPYNFLVKDLGPSDSSIRAALRTALSREHANEPDTVFIDELGLCRGQVRVDVAVVNGVFHGYEIKSDRDSLRRLQLQVELYGKVLDRATLVVGDRFLREVRHQIPRWWGILHVVSTDVGLEFQTIRIARNNPRMDARALVELLWFDNAIALLESKNAVRGVRSRPRAKAWDRICELFSVDEIASAVREALKCRSMTQASA